MGLLSDSNDNIDLLLTRPSPADHRDLSVYHSRDYLDFVLDKRPVSEGQVDQAQLAEYGLEEVSADREEFPVLGADLESRIVRISTAYLSM